MNIANKKFIFLIVMIISAYSVLAWEFNFRKQYENIKDAVTKTIEDAVKGENLETRKKLAYIAAGATVLIGTGVLVYKYGSDLWDWTTRWFKPNQVNEIIEKYILYNKQNYQFEQAKKALLTLKSNDPSDFSKLIKQEDVKLNIALLNGLKIKIKSNKVLTEKKKKDQENQISDIVIILEGKPFLIGLIEDYITKVENSEYNFDHVKSELKKIKSLDPYYAFVLSEKNEDKNTAYDVLKGFKENNNANLNNDTKNKISEIINILQDKKNSMILNSNEELRFTLDQDSKRNKK